MECNFNNYYLVQFNLKLWAGLDLQSGPVKTGPTVPVVPVLIYVVVVLYSYPEDYPVCVSAYDLVKYIVQFTEIRLPHPLF